MTFDELQEIFEPWQSARDTEARLRVERDERICWALSMGWSQREVARAADVSHSLPALILKAHKAKKLSS